MNDGLDILNDCSHDYRFLETITKLGEFVPVVQDDGFGYKRVENIRTTVMKHKFYCTKCLWINHRTEVFDSAGKLLK